MEAALIPTATEKEWPGVQRAIEEISAVKDRLKTEGLSQVAFFVGVANVFITGFLLGRFPQHMWVLYVAKGVVLIPTWLCEVTRRHNGLLFVLDYCWVTNILAVSYMMSVLVMGPSLSHAYRYYGFLWYYAAAMGPLSWACLTLHNGLVFHDLVKTASLFIHFTPSLVAWTLRWSPGVVSAAWPSRFPIHTLETSELGLLYLCGFAPYLVWLFFHGLWLLTVGIKCPEWGYETVFNDLYVKKDLATVWTKRFRCSSVRSHAAIYLLLHAVLVSITFLWSLLCYSFYWVHTIFLVTSMIAVAWIGSGYYTYLITGVYTRALGKLLPSDRRRSCSTAVLEHLNEGGRQA